MSDVRLSPAHRAWLFENLLRGSDAAALVPQLSALGVPEGVSRAEAAQIVASPDFVGARRVVAEGRRHTQVVGLLRGVAREGAPTLAVDRRPDLTPGEFFERYYATNTPVLLPGRARAFGAFGRWTPEHLSARFGDVEIEHVQGRDAERHYDELTPRLSVRAPLREYIARVLGAGETNDVYFVANNHNLDRPELAPLWDDLGDAGGLLDPRRRAGCASLWIGPGGTVTPLHHDTCNVFFTQIFGAKRFTLASPLDTDLLRGARAMYAAVDPEDPASLEGVDARFATVDVEAGDALFVPVGWWHHVRALSVSISVAFSGFARPNHFGWYVPGGLRA